MLQRLLESTQGTKLLQGFLAGDQLDLRDLGPATQLTGDGLGGGIIRLVLQKERDRCGLIPAARHEAQVIRQHIERGGQGERDANHRHRHPRGQGGVHEPAQSGGRRLQMLAEPDSGEIEKSGRALTSGAVFRHGLPTPRVILQPSVAEGEGPVTHALDQVKIVSGDQQGDADVLKTLEEFEDFPR